MRVGRVRTKEKVFIGDGGNEPLTRRMRAHSNFVENTAFVLILLALVELGLGSLSLWLWGVGALYLVGRILHALGMDGMMWGRMAGTAITMLTQLGLAIGAIGDRLPDADQHHHDRDRRNRSRRAEVGRPTLPRAISLTNGFCAPFMREIAVRAVPRQEGRIAAERPQLLRDRIEQLLVIAARKISAADRSLEQHIANDRQLRRSVVERRHAPACLGNG